MNDEGAVRARTQVATPADLAAAREARGMSQVDISHRIKLQVRQVNALEEGQWEALPGKSFVRGALRSYAKLLDVDVTPLLESIGGFAEPTQVHGLHTLESSISRASGHGFNGGGRGSPILWVIAGLVGVVALVLYFGSDQDTSRIRSWLPAGDSPAGTTAAPAPSSEVEVPAPAAPDPSLSGSVATSAGFGTGNGSAAGNGAPGGTAGGGSPTVLNELPVLSGKPPAAASLPSPADPAAAGVTSSTAAAPAGAGEGAGAGVDTAAAAPAPVPTSAMAADGRGQMQVRALEDAWVEVRQADGTALHNGLVKAGSHLELKGNPPYRLVLGNASRVELSYEGKAQDLAPHTRANNIARLQLR